MKWSLRLGSYAGIGVYLHWTFALLIGWIFMMHLNAGQTVVQALAGVGFVVVLFACILLHEFGHALTARRYGVKTRDITLLPIGGVARLERIPEKPMQEFWVAIAGPAVNVVIAAILFIVILSLDRANQLLQVEWFQGRFLVQLMWVNLLIVVFNLLPAFPMDGGRVLRALLSARIGRHRATMVAANIGQGMAILFGIIGFFHNPFLIFIAIFVYLGAQGEAAHVEMQTALKGLKVKDAMMTRFRTLAAGDPLDRALAELLAGSQQDFPVVEDGRVQGVLFRNDLVKALTDGRSQARVGEVVADGCHPVEVTDDLTRTLEVMRANQCATTPVLDGGRIVGLLTLENVGELVMVHAAMEESHARGH
ncbi:site-2 protease family protein [Luteolibacter marinus]|uniref:site-2 protease family protein n=1 Tax=Luteolibacter marinus TaxID=2776705 RepID=UPI00186812B8|nr:site-2 protease family protein [Luteolibacter marinus]